MVQRIARFRVAGSGARWPYLEGFKRTLVYYVDDMVIFNGLSTAYITTLPDYHSPTQEYISSPNNFHGYPDSDDDSDYDDLPHLMDPDDSDDDDMPGLELGLAQAA